MTRNASHFTDFLWSESCLQRVSGEKKAYYGSVHDPEDGLAGIRWGVLLLPITLTRIDLHL